MSIQLSVILWFMTRHVVQTPPFSGGGGLEQEMMVQRCGHMTGSFPECLMLLKCSGIVFCRSPGASSLLDCQGRKRVSLFLMLLSSPFSSSALCVLCFAHERLQAVSLPAEAANRFSAVRLVLLKSSGKCLLG